MNDSMLAAYAEEIQKIAGLSGIIRAGAKNFARGGATRNFLMGAAGKAMKAQGAVNSVVSPGAQRVAGGVAGGLGAGYLLGRGRKKNVNVNNYR